jgi:hypothetical protein
VRLEPLAIFSPDVAGGAMLFVFKPTTGGTVKYQSANERAIKITPIRKITAGLSALFLVLAKLAHHFLDFNSLSYYNELLILYAPWKVA